MKICGFERFQWQKTQDSRDSRALALECGATDHIGLLTTQDGYFRNKPDCVAVFVLLGGNISVCLM